MSHHYSLYLFLSQEFSCTDQKYDCYVIDSSGYVVLAHDNADVGRFFGTIHPHVLQSFIDKNIYEHVDVFNYQALCPLSALPDIPSNAWLFSTVRNFIIFKLCSFVNEQTCLF